MNASLIRRATQSLVALIATSLVGCASLDTDKVVAEKVEKAKIGPQAAPYKAITNFSSGLRSMDNMLLDFGVRDIAVIVEDLTDQRKKINAPKTC